MCFPVCFFGNLIILLEKYLLKLLVHLQLVLLVVLSISVDEVFSIYIFSLLVHHLIYNLLIFSLFYGFSLHSLGQKCFSAEKVYQDFL